MKRLEFDQQGMLIGVDGKSIEYNNRGFDKRSIKSHTKLKTSDSLYFLNDTKEDKFEHIFDTSCWSLHANGEKLEALKFSNGKTQEDVVKEVVNLIKTGSKIVFIHGVCGTGKSAIALNIARLLGKASIVVPVKGLQRQYEEDYMGKKYLLKQNGEKMKIAMITGRDNHDSIFKPGFPCSDPFLPDTIKITEKNSKQILEYYEENPLIKNKTEPIIQKLKRISIAPANPYWSPILPVDFELNQLKDAKKLKYRGLGGKDFIFYHRKNGCSYYDQYLAYIYADVIIFNSAKYKIEVSLNKKPETAVDIIDEADEFLDSFSTQEELNLTRLAMALKNILPDSPEAEKIIKEIIELIGLEEKQKHALGIDENQIFPIKETKLDKILRLFLKNLDVGAEISLDELNYANKAMEVARVFSEFLDDTYVTYRREDRDVYASFVTTNLSKKFREIIDKNKAIVLMSGTLHSERVLKNIFGIENFKIVEAEGLHQGTIEICKTGKEFDCKYSNFDSKKYSRKDYLLAFSACMEKAKKPILVHVNAFEDLPSELELGELDITNIMSKEKLRELQFEDKTGRMVSLFKSRLSDVLFSTKCSRGVDFPGDMCNSVVFTKYPNPNVRGIFWKVLQKTHPTYYWDFYRDKARREFLQRIYRALRFKEDHVYVLSPDSRVLDAVKEIQNLNSEK